MIPILLRLGGRLPGAMSAERKERDLPARLLLYCLLLAGVLVSSCKKDDTCDNCLPGGNQPPVANAGTDLVTTLSTNQVVLDGTASRDPDGSIVSWQWSKVAGPQPHSLSASNAVKPIVKDLATGVYRFELTVTDNGGLQAKDTVQVTVHPVLVSTAPDCNNGNRPLVTAHMTPVGTLSLARWGMAVAAAGNTVVFAGGLAGNTLSSRVDIYDVVTNNWSTAELSKARHSMAAIGAGNKIFLAGGDIGDGTFPVHTIDIFDVATSTWTSSALSVPGYMVATAAAGNKVLFAGGEGGYPGIGRDRTVDIYDLTSGTWSTASLSEGKAGGHTTVTAGNKIYIGGGGFYNPSTNQWNYSHRIDVYDATANTWSIIAMMEGKTGMAAIYAGGKIYWAGGMTGTGGPISTVNSSCTVEIIDTAGMYSPSISLHKGRDRLMAVVKDNKIIYYAPYGDDNKIDIYDIATGAWSIGVLPFTIGDASVISVNNTVYIAGGVINGVLSNQVWKLEF